MGSTFAVSTDRLATSSTDTARICAEVETSVESLMARLISMQDEWTGTASASFQDLINDWRATQKTVKENLDQIGRVLGEAGETYRSTEENVRSAMALR